MLFKRGSEEERLLIRSLRERFGIKPKDLEIYKKAFTHRSVLVESPEKISNERLEFLGDAVLDSIVAEYLFTELPDQEEGALTRIKAAIVSRRNLSRLAMKMGLEELVDFRDKRQISVETITGNALEAVIGAMLLDLGYKKTKKAVIQQMIKPYTDLDDLEENSIDPKSELIIWAQRTRKAVVFREDEEVDHGHSKEYKVTVLIDGKPIASGKGRSKKKAEKDAAKNSLGKIGD